MIMNTALLGEVDNFLKEARALSDEQKAVAKTREKLLSEILRLQSLCKENREAIDIATHAIEILQSTSEKSVEKAYEFLESSINSTLEKMFTHSTRKIKIETSDRNHQYPQLQLALYVGDGKKRSLKKQSGHGIGQIISFLTILTLIVITGSRRVVLMDEILSGVSAENKEILDTIMWSFTEIGFQFLMVEHGFIPKGAHVYELKMSGDATTVVNDWIQEEGFYADPKVEEQHRKTDDDEDEEEEEAV